MDCFPFTSDPYVKLGIVLNGASDWDATKLAQTDYISNDLNPVWSAGVATFVFDNVMADDTLGLECWDHDLTVR
jgi:Ca2+-dependent lipid-binding protein